MFVFFLNILRQKSGRYVCVQLLQTLNILFENISHETSLCKDHFWGHGLPCGRVLTVRTALWGVWSLGGRVLSVRTTLQGLGLRGGHGLPVRTILFWGVVLREAVVSARLVLGAVVSFGGVAPTMVLNGRGLLIEGVASPDVRPTLGWACFPSAFVSLLWMSLPGWVWPPRSGIHPTRVLSIPSAALAQCLGSLPYLLTSAHPILTRQPAAPPTSGIRGHHGHMEP